MYSVHTNLLVLFIMETRLEAESSSVLFSEALMFSENNQFWTHVYIRFRHSVYSHTLHSKSVSVLF